MLYQLEQGEVEGKIIKDCIRNHLPLPNRILNAPELMPGLELYFLGFYDLTNSRSFGMGLGPIPWNVIQEYCTILNLSTDQAADMHYHISAMDKVFLAHHAKKAD